jgi:hypothetical protein
MVLNPSLLGLKLNHISLAVLVLLAPSTLHRISSVLKHMSERM